MGRLEKMKLVQKLSCGELKLLDPNSFGSVDPDTTVNTKIPVPSPCLLVFHLFVVWQAKYLPILASGGLLMWSIQSLAFFIFILV
jgi:hypothetical protein